MTDLIPVDIERMLASLEGTVQAVREFAETSGEVADSLNKIAKTLARIEIALEDSVENNGKEKELITVYMDPRWENKYDESKLSK